MLFHDHFDWSLNCSSQWSIVVLEAPSHLESTTTRDDGADTSEDGGSGGAVIACEVLALEAEQTPRWIG